MGAAVRQGVARSTASQTREPPSTFAKFHRPLMLGLSVGHPIGTVCSVGPFVTLKNGQPGFLSVSFSLAPKGAAVGDWIHQPGPYDAALLTGATRVGKLAGVAAPSVGKICRVAAAAVELIDVKTDGNVLPQETPQGGRKISEVAGVDDIAVGDEVAFVGCTSGYSHGRVSSLDWDNLEVGGFKFGGAFGVIASDGTNFSEPGDGGALIYRCSDMKALGVVFARMNHVGRQSETLGLSLGPALEAFGAVLSD
jgi:hypothetical protein